MPRRIAQEIGFIEFAARNLRGHRMIITHGFNEPRVLQWVRRVGGVLFQDERGDLWIEEYLVDPPTHILNGMIWALWGVHDYALATGDPSAHELFGKVVQTIERNLARYDAGFWSLYEQSGTRLKMMASPFYHRLHIVQLGIMRRLTGHSIFGEYAERWERYERSRIKSMMALAYKSAFKLCYY